jgi:Phospholipase_D-nuclease N-terminal
MIGFLCVLIAVVAFIDACRRPASQWAQADRNRAFWLTMIVLLNVIGVAAYLIGVLPRFQSGSSSTDAELLKRL